MALNINTNEYTTALALDDYAQEPEGSVENFFKYGISASITSGAVSFYNTGKAALNVVGADFERTDSKDVLNAMGLTTTARYYDANRQFIDAVGFGIGAIIPGLGGIRAAQAMKAGVTSYNGSSKFVLGVKETLYPKEVVSRYTERLMKEKAYPQGNATYVIDAAKQGFKNQAVETLFAEAAILVSMNQSPTLTGGELDYFRGIYDNLDTAALGYAFGTGIGGIVETAITYKALKGLVVGEFQKVNKAAGISVVPADVAPRSAISGDYLALLAGEKERAQTALSSMQGNGITGDAFAAAQIQKNIDYLEGLAAGWVDKLTQRPKWAEKLPTETAKFLNASVLGVVKQLDSSKTKDVFGGATRVGIAGDESLLMDVRLSPLHILDKEHDAIAEYASNWYAAKGYDTKRPEVQDAIKREIKDMKGTGGATRPSTVFGVTSADAKTIYSYVFDSPEVPMWRKIQTARHEIGHNHTLQLAKMAQTKFGSELFGEAEKLSREMRPASWREVDKYEAILNGETNQTLLEKGFTGKDINQMRKYVAYMRKPEELLADSWAAFETELFKGDRASSKLYNVFAQNAAAKARYGSNEVLLDVVTKELHQVANRVPTIADLGEVKFLKVSGSKGVTVSHSNGTTNWDYKTPLDLTKESFTSMSAKYAAASSKSFKFPAQLEVPTTDLPTMLGLILRAEQTDPKLMLTSNVKLKGADGSVIELDFSKKGLSDNERSSMVKMLRKEQILAKAKLLDDIRNARVDVTTGKFGSLEIARMLDVSEDVVDTLTLQARDPATLETLLREDARAAVSWSEVYDPAKPTAAKISYMASRTTEAEVKALADVEIRMQNNLKFADDSIRGLVAGFFKDKVKLTPSTMLVSRGQENLAQTVTPVTGVGGVAASVQGNYSDMISVAQQYGANNAKLKELVAVDIEEKMSTAKAALLRNQEAMYEYAALDSFLRTGHYKPLPTDAVTYGTSIRAEAVAIAEAAAKDAKATPAMKANSAEFVRIVDDVLLPKIQSAGGVTQLISREFENLLNTALEGGATKPLLRQLEAAIDKEFKAVKSREVADLFTSAKEARSFQHQAGKTMASLDGSSFGIDSEVWYPGKLDRARYKEVAFVVPKVQGLFAGNKKMIVGAPTKEAYDAKVAQVVDAFGSDVRIITPRDAAEYKKFTQEFDNDLAFTDWDVNSMMKKRGLMADVAPEPTPQMVEHFFSDIVQGSRNSVDALFQRLYKPEVDALTTMHRKEVMGREGNTLSGQAGDKKFSSSFSKVLDVIFNRQSHDLESYRGMQEKFDNAFSTVANTVGSLFKSAKKPVDFEKLNNYLDQYGLPKVYNEDVTDYLVRTEKINTRVLSEWIPKLNGAAATLMLRWDYIQPIVTAISMPITMHPEFRHLLDEVPELKRQQLLAMDSVVNPATGIAESKSLTPLIYQAVKDFHGRKDLVEYYSQLDLLGGIAREQMQAVDLLSVTPAQLREGTGLETSFKGAAKKLAELAAKPADTAEEFAKFVAARVAHQVLDTAGITEESIRQRVMRTFVTRTMGNYNAAQRPGLFQGPVGQLFGLFQTYQFNLIQQMLRHMGDSPRRAAAMMGIQAGIFGAQSVPGFQILNAHIAEKSGYETDFYNGSNEAIGNTAAEWIVYGAASNFVRPVFGDGIELYTRGDLNPRTPILIPTSLSEVPTISMATRAWSSISNLASNIGNGAPAGEAVVQALSTIGINRPLQGIAQLVQGARTTTRGTELVNLDDLNWAQMGMRALGAKGLNESIAVNAYYRSQQYELARQEKVNQIGMAARLALRDNDYDSNTYYNFMESYASAGGNLDNYTTWMHNNAVNATQGAISRMAIDNRGVEGRYMQTLMGGKSEQYSGAIGADDTPYIPQQ